MVVPTLFNCWIWFVIRLPKLPPSSLNMWTIMISNSSILNSPIMIFDSIFMNYCEHSITVIQTESCIEMSRYSNTTSTQQKINITAPAPAAQQHPADPLASPFIPYAPPLPSRLYCAHFLHCSSLACCVCLSRCCSLTM